ncbi:PAAR domain-containing protein [Zestomonas carbonaria]|uniref:Type IV secretion protein Rhs n=1 Tax=Zestomonas carbonaria TaxID=2762745 RepID=A0A7U7IBQ4_9GAMM|nr:PAAR domain-containing protein [Pseudomonas carbonaria]CAD5109182.1 hypothetical protein PSEWESI4_03478 [Pseudomonas carbonaria]
MRRYHITVGAQTTAGGTVITGVGFIKIEGQPIAAEGDSVACPACNSVGVIALAGPHHKEILNGRNAALEGDLCLCKCSPPPLLIANQSLRFQEFSSSEVAALATSAPRQTKPAARPIAPGSQPLAPEGAEALEEEEEEEELEGIVLRLGLFFDGTSNNQANSDAASGCYAINLGIQPEVAEGFRQHCSAYGYDGDGNTPDNSYGNDVSNVARLYRLYPGQADSLYSQGSGRGDTGIVARVEQAPALILEQLQLLLDNNPSLKIRRIEFDLFGFSRGAAAARHCANDLLKGPDSLLARALPAGSSLLANSFAWRHKTDYALNFIGLFDTVAGVVAPSKGDFSAHNARNPGIDLGLPPGIARRVVHLVAANEYRHNFSLTRTDHDIRLPGAHSDIGGGYLPLATERIFLTRPDSSRVSQGTRNENTEAYVRTRRRLERGLPNWRPYAQRLGIALWDMELPRERRGHSFPEKRVYAAVGSERQVRGELSLVYLRIMRELAVRAGVAFNRIDDRDPALALPDELQPVAAKLQAYALNEPLPGLSEEERAMLCRHYIHLSAHWNAAWNKYNSALEVVFINRPTANGKRMEHPNE